MNILHLSSESSWRGGEQQIAYLMEETAAKGVKPMVAGRPHSAFESFSNSKNWIFYPLEMKNSIDFRSASQLKNLCKKLEIDIIHVHSSRSHGIAYLSFLMGNRTKILVSRRVDFPLKDNWLSKHKYNISAVQKIVCVSDAIRDMVIPHLAQPEKCITIHSGVDIHKFEDFRNNDYLRKQYKISSDTILIGNTSAIAPHKDYFTFIDTVEEFLKNYSIKVKFFIIGSGPMQAEIEAYIQKKGVEEHMILTGFLENIKEVLPSLDVFLITSETEGLGTSILDAFAAKVPVVATAAGGIPELVKHEETGLLSAIKDPKELAKQLNELLSNLEKKEKLVNGAFDLVKNKSKQNMANAYLAIYKSILEQ